MNRYSTSIILIIALSLIFTACKKEDEELPEIVIMSGMMAIGDTVIVEAPMDFPVRIALVDEGGLQAYRFALESDSVVSGDIDRVEVADASGNAAMLIIDDTLRFDEEAEGRRLFSVSASDEAGNFNESGPFTFLVSNTEIPEVVATSWSCGVSSQFLSLNEADTLQVNYEATDPDGLSSMSLRLMEGGVETLFSSQEISTTSVVDSMRIDLPETLIEPAILELIVQDELGNTSRQRYELSP